MLAPTPQIKLHNFKPAVSRFRAEVLNGLRKPQKELCLVSLRSSTCFYLRFCIELFQFHGPQRKQSMPVSRRKFITGAAATTAGGIIIGRVDAAPKVASLKERPLFVSTWPFGKPANEMGLKVLQDGGSILDAVERGIGVVEADPSNHSVGLAGLPDDRRVHLALFHQTDLFLVGLLRVLSGGNEHALRDDRSVRIERSVDPTEDV